MTLQIQSSLSVTSISKNQIKLRSMWFVAKPTIFSAGARMQGEAMGLRESEPEAGKLRSRIKAILTRCRPLGQGPHALRHGRIRHRGAYTFELAIRAKRARSLSPLRAHLENERARLTSTCSSLSLNGPVCERHLSTPSSRGVE